MAESSEIRGPKYRPCEPPDLLGSLGSPYKPGIPLKRIFSVSGEGWYT